MDQKLVKTPDEWFPTLPGSKVEVTLHEDAPGTHRVAIWGEDDFGMEKVFTTADSLGEALLMFHSIKSPVKIEWLKQQGFVNA